MGFSFDNVGSESRRASSSDAGFSEGEDFSWEGDAFSDDFSPQDSQRQDSASGSASTFTDLDDDEGFSFTGAGADGGATPYGDARPGSPPIPFLAASGGLSIVGAVLALAFQQSWLMLALGWLLAGPLAILALGQYIQKDSVQRARPIYQGGPMTRHYATILGALALLSVVTVAVLAAGKVARAW